MSSGWAGRAQTEGARVASPVFSTPLLVPPPLGPNTSVTASITPVNLTRTPMHHFRGPPAEKNCSTSSQAPVLSVDPSRHLTFLTSQPLADRPSPPRPGQPAAVRRGPPPSRAHSPRSLLTNPTTKRTHLLTVKHASTRQRSRLSDGRSSGSEYATGYPPADGVPAGPDRVAGGRGKQGRVADTN